MDLQPVPVLVAGVDEAGRGCLAGPVFAAAVILHPGQQFAGLDDSKKLSAAARERLFGRIVVEACAWAIASASVAEIDRLNILHASMLAMHRAVRALQPAAEHCLIDGNRLPTLPCPGEAVIGGDGLHASIMAASVLAKVARDRELVNLHGRYPGYGLARHKGYGTRDHVSALQTLGPSPIHRRSFAPCRLPASQAATLA